MLLLQTVTWSMMPALHYFHRKPESIAEFTTISSSVESKILYFQSIYNIIYWGNECFIKQLLQFTHNPNIFHMSFNLHHKIVILVHHINSYLVEYLFQSLYWKENTFIFKINVVYSGVHFLCFTGFSCCYHVPYQHVYTCSLTHQCGSQQDPVIAEAWMVCVQTWPRQENERK